MSFRHAILVLGFLCACDSLTKVGGDASAPEPDPLPADLVAACPDSVRFERTGSRACTEIGCVNGLLLNVSPASGWAPGAYSFELEVDGRAVTCQGSIPLKPCGEQSFSCNADGVRLGESGCALPATQQGISNIDLEGFPLALSVRVVKDGNELTSTKLEPKYMAGQPNGRGCDPICCSASAELKISAKD